MPAVIKNTRRKDREPNCALEASALTRLNQTIQATSLEHAPISSVHGNPRNAKKHPDQQIDLLIENYKQFGWSQPIIIDENGMILCGHARYLAALKCGVSHLPAIRLSHLSETEKRALAIADNKLAELGQWNEEILAAELKTLFDPKMEMPFDPRLVGFETVELDQILDEQPPARRADRADRVQPPNPASIPTTAAADVWICDQHKVICGNGIEKRSYQGLMGDEQADVVFTVPPSNAPNAGRLTGRAGVSGLAAGEMLRDQSSRYAATFCECILPFVLSGAILYICADWRRLQELQSGVSSVLGPPKDLIVWIKSNAGTGAFYRSQHEMILVYCAPGGKPINNFGLRGTGRYRTNVWTYPAFKSIGRGTDAALALQPVDLVADALMDCSNRRGIVLDPFGGSGTTMIAAERTGRHARLIEINPINCDLIVQRWQIFSGKTARLAETNETFDQVSLRRGAGVNLRGK